MAALVCSDRAWDSYLRETAAGTPVRIVLTACELDLQTRNDARVLNFERLPQAADADDLVARRPARAQGARRPRGRPRRHRADQLHLGHQRRSQGRHQHTRQHHVQRRAAAHRARPARDARLLRAGAAVPHHRHGLPARRVPQQRGHARARVPLRGRGRARRVRRAPAGLHGRPLDRLHGARRAPGRHPRPLLLVPDDLLRRRAAAARPGGEVPRRLRPLHPQRLRAHRVHRALRLRTARPGSPRGPGLRDAGRRRTRSRHRRTHRRRPGRGGALRRAGRDPRPRPAGRARLLAPAPRPPPRPSPKASCAPATSASWTPRAGSTSSTARRT